jgi:Lon protease-like protein
VPLFPLPNVVLFPRAVLPLHIFEDRYKLMTAHALAGDRRVAMALLRPGWEKSYYCKPAIEPVVCVGEILTHEKLPDGNYNFLLRGLTRATVVRELTLDRPYRLAELRPLDETPAMEIDLEAERLRLAEVFGQGPLARSPVGRQFRQMLATSLPTADLADLIAFTYLDDVPLKQSLLADGDVRRRVARTIDALDAMRPVPQTAGGYPAYQGPDDPSVN